MPRDRDWVDYANLASNVIQNAQLSSLNDKMSQLAELEHQKEYREQQESAVAHCEDILREAVFFYTEQLRDVEELADKNSQQTFVRASHLKGTYDRMPQFSTSGFRKFEDKERLANVTRTCERLIRDSAAQLNPVELADAKICVDHLFGREELVKIIDVQKEKEKLEKLRARTAKRAAPLIAALNDLALRRARIVQRPSNPILVKIYVSMVGVGLAVVALLFACGVLYYLIDERGADHFMTSHAMGLVTNVLGAGVVVAGIGGLGLEVPKYLRKLSAKRFSQEQDRIARELAIVNREVDRIQAYVNEHAALYSKFGEATSDRYRLMLAERDELLVKVAGDAAKSFVQRNQP